MRLVEYEDVTYNLEEIRNTTWMLIYNYVKYSGIPQTAEWIDTWPYIKKHIENQRTKPTHLVTSNIELVFSGIPQPTLQAENLSGDPKLTYPAKEPYIKIDNKLGNLSPSEKQLYLLSYLDISREMEEVYHLHPLPDDTVLVFPKKDYSTAINIFSVPLLERAV